MSSGASARTAAAQFGVSVASAVRWSQRQRQTGGVAPGKLGGHRKPVLLPEREWLLARVAAEPDLTLRGLLADLADRGVKASYGALWLFLEREGLSFKKSLFASEQDRPAIARRRMQWRKYQNRLDPTRLVFIDETWAKTNMTRTHGRARRGERLHAKVPFGHWRTLTFLAALRHDRIDARACSTGQSTASSSSPMSSSSSYLRLPPATSSSWTTSVVTKGRPCVRPSAVAGPDLVPSALQSRPQSNRTGLRQAQDAPAKGQRTIRRSHVEAHRLTARPLLPDECANYLRNSGYASA
jgi:transposase